MGSIMLCSSAVAVVLLASSASLYSSSMAQDDYPPYRFYHRPTVITTNPPAEALPPAASPASPPATVAPSSQGQMYHLVTKVTPNFCLTGCDDGSVIMAPCNGNDFHQLWIKDDSWGRKLEDSAGCRAFALINMATGRALRHGTFENQQVGSFLHDNSDLDDHFLWTMSPDFGQDFHTIRMYTNINLNLDVDHGDRKNGGIKYQSKLILFRWKKGDNQLWKLLQPCL